MCIIVLFIDCPVTLLHHVSAIDAFAPPDACQSSKFAQKEAGYPERLVRFGRHLKINLRKNNET